MAHFDIKTTVQQETGRASALLIATLMGGMLVISSFVAEYLFTSPIRDATGALVNPHVDILALLGALLLGFPLVWHAVTHLAQGEMHMDELVALAIAAAIALGEYQEAGVIAFFMIISNLIETRTALGARASIESLLRLTPPKAHLVNADGTEHEIESKKLRAGMIFRVRPGDNIPADGEIIRGESSINQANITGESIPADKYVGDEVFGGTSNLTGAIDVRVTKAGEDATLGRVRHLILEAEKTRLPLMRLIDRYAGWYTPTIVMLAGIVWYFTEDKMVAMEKAITMLIVACPCALVLATPTAMVAALSCAARLGILIKNVIHLEYARNLTAVVFDKTGTLTTGELSVTQLRPIEGIDGADMLHAAASVEQLSKHPAARAVVNVAREANITLGESHQFKEEMGKGVSATLQGTELLVGRRTWLEERGINMGVLDDSAYAEPEGVSVLYVARGGSPLGWIGLEDKTRGDARAAIDELRSLGVKHLSMVTGDKWSVAKRVAAEMGCTEVQAEVLPAEKLTLVDELKKRGHKVMVVGDGVNDAPALAAGNMGVAMGAAGSDVAINSASVALLNNDLSRLPFLIRLSRATTKVIWQNLIFGVAFIVVTQTMAIWGELKPIMAAMLHTVATAFVIFNSARLVRFGEEPGQEETYFEGESSEPGDPHEHDKPETADTITMG
ncbi:MAG: cation-translocating P-type ATPase, partial [Planctomycetes bacterium]|nr:cation-translocating P-type ATPase [Planctomycetota bacterium]